MIDKGVNGRAGWFMPTGYMVGSGIMPVVNRDKKVNADAESFASFFGGVCAPRVTGEGPAFVSEEEGAETTSYAPLCELCSKGPNGNGCEEESNYADYLGAFRGE